MSNPGYSFLLPWFMLSLILPVGLWVTVGATLVFLSVAHKAEWSVVKTTALGLITILIVTVMVITIGS